MHIRDTFALHAMGQLINRWGPSGIKHPAEIARYAYMMADAMMQERNKPAEVKNPMHDRSEWTRGQSGPQVIKGKTYTNLVEFHRPCMTCEKLFSIFVTAKIANGHADSNSFGLKNCEEHRRNKPAADLTEIEVLRTANVTMREELTGLYARNKEMFEELQALKAQLVQYDLPSAFAAIGCEAVQNTSNGVLPSKMPWE